MKRFTSSVALGAFVVALVLPAVAAAETAAQAPAKPSVQAQPAPAPAPAPSAPAKTTKPATGTTAKPTKEQAAAEMPKVDLNTASKDELMKVPGVGDATADKIIAARPFKTRTELVSKNILTSAQFAKVRTLVAAMPAPKSASK